MIPPDNQSNNGLTRRDFIRSAAAAGFAAAAFPTIIPSSALGKDGAVAPSNRITVGVIGCGPQGQLDMRNFLFQDNCQIVAVCDVKNDQLEQARALVNNKYGNQDCRTAHDFRELVARKDIDACLIATPDHWHVLVALAAVNSGKDVYVEKPLGLSLAEDQALRAAVHRKKRVFQFGTQQRSVRHFRYACELVRNGAIGRLKHINAWAPGSAPGGSREIVPVPKGWDYDMWLGPAAFRPHTQDLCTADNAKKTWWFVSDFALGFIAGWAIHPMDIAAWGAGELMNGPFTVEGRGNFRLAEGICDTATIWEVDYQFASGLTMKCVGVPNGGNDGQPTGEPFLHGEEWQKRYRRTAGHGTAFEGADGWVHVDRDGINYQPEGLAQTNPDDLKIKLIQSRNHASNFLDSVKSRSETICPIDDAVKSDILCHAAAIAMRLERKLTFDFDKEHFIRDNEANRHLQARSMRAPWHL
jgi:predicted dehydrogenase